MKKAIEIIPLKGVKMDNLDIDLGNDIAVIFSVFYKQLIQYSVAVYVSFTITLRNNGVT